MASITKSSSQLEYTSSPLYQSCILALVGTPGSGKSTLGKLISLNSNFSIFDVDQARKELEQIKVFSSEKEAMEESYKANHEKARNCLNHKQPIILAATYSREFYHNMLNLLAEQTHVPLIIIRVIAPLSKIEASLEERRRQSNDSNVTSMNHYLEVANRFKEPPGSIPIDTSYKTPKESMEEIQRILKQFQIAP